MRTISISLSLLFLCFSIFPIYAERGYVFHVLDVTHPEVVKPNEEFNIDVKIGYWIGPYYRNRIQLQIRVFDYNNDQIILIKNFEYNQFMILELYLRSFIAKFIGGHGFLNKESQYSIINN